MAQLLSTSDFLDCLPPHALRRLLEDIRAIDEPMARSVQRDVERLILEKLARPKPAEPRPQPSPASLLFPEAHR